MKIAAIRATPILVPLEAPSHRAAGILDSFVEHLIGLDAPDIAGLDRRILPWMPRSHSVTDHALRGAWGGVEIALWDQRGKPWGQPVANLPGEIHRDRIPFTDYFSCRLPAGDKGGEQSIAAVVDYWLALRDSHGATFFEGKVSDPDLGANIRLMQALREALGPDAMLRIDSNQAFSLPSCIYLAPAFQELGIRNWEDPTPDWRQMKKLRARTTIPFSGHNTDLGKAVAYGVPDAIVSDVAGFGGFAAAMRFVSACQGAGVDFWCYSGGSGLETAAYLHLCAAHPHIREPNQSLLRQQPFDVIAEGAFVAKANTIALPDRPGLGVTLDPDRLRFAANLLKERGLPNKYHDPGLPGQMRRMPLI